MFLLDTPTGITATDIRFQQEVLETGHCGLFRAPLHLAAGLMPSMAGLIETVPVDDPEHYELDIKIHMLMKGQYPCIPNWHTDMVPRDHGETRFDLIRPQHKMFLWVSDGPTTEFLAEPCLIAEPKSHGDIADAIRSIKPYTRKIRPNRWYAMDQRTPHRGTVAEANGWRVFARVTPRVLAPQRPVHSVIRRHAQVYLNADLFSW